MPEWVVFLVLLVVLRNVLSRGACGSRRHERIARGAGVGSERPVARPRAAAALPPTDPVTELQRAWVEGRITDAEFEAGLDRVYRHG